MEQQRQHHLESKPAGAGETGVLFDKVVVLNNNDTSPTAGVTVTHSGDELFAIIPLSVLPSTGFAPQNYTWNLWPCDPLFASGNAAVSDFAPDNSDAAVTLTPEPGALTLAGLGVLGLVCFGRRWRKAAAA
jgi:hypothetical protein